MTKVYAPHLAIIRESIAAIERYRPDERETFLAGPMLQDAILMRLQVIGENLSAMRRIDEARFAAIAPDAWYQRIGLRNVISHGYETINPERIWQMIVNGLSDLRTSLAVLDDARGNCDS